MVNESHGHKVMIIRILVIIITLLLSLNGYLYYQLSVKDRLESKLISSFQSTLNKAIKDEREKCSSSDISNIPDDGIASSLRKSGGIR